MLQFRKDMFQLLELEGHAADRIRQRNPYISRMSTAREWHSMLQREAAHGEEYGPIRGRIVAGVRRATRIAGSNGVTILALSAPPPMIAGSAPVIPVNFFEAVLHDQTYGGMDDQLVVDALNQTVSACQEKIEEEWKHTINPLFWVKALLILVIRLPFMICEASGFNVSKIEDHLLSKMFKLIEILVLLYLLYRLGISRDQVRDLLMRLMPGR